MNQAAAPGGAGGLTGPAAPGGPGGEKRPGGSGGADGIQAPAVDGQRPGVVVRIRGFVTTSRARALAEWEAIQRARPRHRSLDTAFSTYERDEIHGGGLLAAALAYRFFFWTLPFALLVVGLLGFVPGSAKDAAKSLGVLGFASHTIAEAGAEGHRARWVAVLVGLYALYATSVSYVKTLRIAHALVWELRIPPLGSKLKAAGAMNGFLVIIFVTLAVEQRIRQASRVGGLVVGVLFLVLIAALWLVVSWRLPHAATSWTELVPGAIVVAVGAEFAHLVTVYYIARKIERASATYGALGAASAILLSLFFLARIVIAGAALNSYLAERRTRHHHLVVRGDAVVQRTPGSEEADGAGRAERDSA